MVAVQGQVLKASKVIPDSLKWNGKPETLESFIGLLEEWVEIRLGDEALMVVQGLQKNESGDLSMCQRVCM